MCCHLYDVISERVLLIHHVLHFFLKTFDSKSDYTYSQRYLCHEEKEKLFEHISSQQDKAYNTNKKTDYKVVTTCELHIDSTVKILVSSVEKTTSKAATVRQKLPDNRDDVKNELRRLLRYKPTNKQ